jgi:uncharacterized protein
MNSQERDVIAGIFQRLEQAANQPRDAEAERFIADRLRAQPYAPYALAQLVYVQEEAIKSLNQQLEQARAQAQGAPQQGGGGGFLSSIFGGGSRQEPPPQGRPGGPWGAPGGGYPQQGGYPQGQPGYGGGYAQPQGMAAQGMAPQGRGSGFLGSALTTAAGVAGGMVVGSALMNAFSGGHSALGSLASTGGETVNNFFGSDANADTANSADFGAPLGGGDDASFQDASFDDGGDLGGGGDDDWV